MDKKKSYKGLFIWLLCYLLLMVLIIFLPIENAAILTRLMFLMTNAMIVILMYIIYRTGNIYWFTTFSYEDVQKYDEQTKKNYAKKVYILFLKYFVVYLLFTILMQILSLPYWIDIVVFCVSLAAVCILDNVNKIGE